MAAYPMDFATTHLSDLLARAEAGEEVIIARDQAPVVRLVLVAGETVRLRRPGRLAGKLRVGREFFEPLPPEELASWDGG